MPPVWRAPRGRRHVVPAVLPELPASVPPPGGGATASATAGRRTGGRSRGDGPRRRQGGRGRRAAAGACGLALSDVRFPEPTGAKRLRGLHDAVLPVVRGGAARP